MNAIEIKEGNFFWGIKDKKDIEEEEKKKKAEEKDKDKMDNSPKKIKPEEEKKYEEIPKSMNDLIILKSINLTIR